MHKAFFTKGWDRNRIYVRKANRAAERRRMINMAWLTGTIDRASVIFRRNDRLITTDYENDLDNDGFVQRAQMNSFIATSYPEARRRRSTVRALFRDERTEAYKAPGDCVVYDDTNDITPMAINAYRFTVKLA
jgi:cytochrome P450